MNTFKPTTLRGLFMLTLVLGASACPLDEADCEDPLPIPPPPLCSLGCRVSSANISIRTVRPQDDFFRAVNGKWIDSAEIPTDRDRNNSFEVIHDTTERQLHHLLEAAAAKHAPAGSIEERIGDQYASFMDEATIDELGIHPLDAEIARIDAVQNHSDIAGLIAHLHVLGVKTPLSIAIYRDNRDTSRYTVDLAQGDLSLPNGDY